MYGVVYMDDPTAFVYMDQTADVTITAAMVGTEVTIPLANPIPVSTGEGYVVGIGHYGGTDALTIQSGGVAPVQTVFILDASDNVWYYMTSIPMIRANMVPTVGLAEGTTTNGITLGQNYPNPTNGTTTISYEIAASAQVTLEVFDITGKLVLDVNEGTQVAGEHNIVLDANSLSAGAYNYSLVVDGQRLTRTMMITK
jgi:hypothetical protein